MTTDHQIKNGKLQYDINTEAVKISYHQVKLITMNILQVKKFDLLIKNK